MKLPTFVVEKLALPMYLEPILSYLRGIMMRTPALPILRTHNIVKVPREGSMEQDWHYDHPFGDHATKHSYFTLLIPLNSIDKECGGTEIYLESPKRSKLVSSSYLFISICFRFALVLVIALYLVVISNIVVNRIMVAKIGIFIMPVFLVHLI
jgi:hypothetical protein